MEKTFKESVAIDDYHLHAAEMMEQAFNVILECIVSHNAVPAPAVYVVVVHTQCWSIVHVYELYSRTACAHVYLFCALLIPPII